MPTATKEEAQAAERAGVAKVNEIVQSRTDPRRLFKASRGVVFAPEGDYRLTAAAWHELVSAPNEPKRFAKHVRGEIVHLKEHDAERLLRAGAVEPTTDEQAESDAAKAEKPLEQAQRRNAGREIPAPPESEG